MSPAMAAAHVDANEAARRLGVSRSTLYAYVSRGLIRSRPTTGSRAHRYAVADLDALLLRRRARRDPGAAAAEALGMQGARMHGLPVLDSSLTLIHAGRLYYRGRDALALARDSTLEDVAALLWDAPLPEAEVRGVRPSDVRRLGSLPLIPAFHSFLAKAGAADPAAYNFTPNTVRRVGAGILRGLAQMAVGASAPSQGSQPLDVAVSEVLARGWSVRGRVARRTLEAALILSADHELNVSAFTARCVASAGATPYMAVSGALAALSGHKHGGHVEWVARLLDEPGDARDVVAARLRQGREIPGFGSPLYPAGDPRGRHMMAVARDDRAHAICRAVHELLGLSPNLDLGLVAVARSLGLPTHAALALFAVGRTVGWIAHVLEQYEVDALIRPRARYVGVEPER